MISYNEKYWEDTERVIAHIPDIERLYGKKILITGATGMICSAVTEILLHLNKVHKADIKIILAGRSEERIKKRFYASEYGKDYFYIYFDATDNFEFHEQVDYIIHGASNATPATYTSQPVETMLANLIGLHSLLKYTAENSVSRMLYISSSEVYGCLDNKTPFEENVYGTVDILNPRNCYPNAKRTAETLCISYNQEYHTDTVIVRPGHIYGPTITNTDNRASAQFTRNAVNGENIVMKSAGLQLRSYCYTMDCASAILAVLLNGITGNAYNISNPDSVVTIRDVACALAEYAGTEVVFENPDDTEKKGYNLMSDSSLKSEKLESLGWSAEFSLKEGIAHTVDFLK